MKKIILINLLRIARFFGIFSLARLLTSQHLRILCYHGSALDDENEFRPGLFMTRNTFERRMAYLEQAEYPVLELSDALHRHREGRLPKSAVVITIDDGWYGTYKNQLPILMKYGFPATLYIASYYLDNQTPVFNVAVSYILWKSGTTSLPASAIDDLLGEPRHRDETLDVEEISSRINRFADSLDGAHARQALLRKFGTLVGYDSKLFEEHRLISFMNASEARHAASNGIDIQLHSHRHRFPDIDFELARTEIADNRRSLDGLGSSALQHFCYPSGIYSDKSIAYLRELEIESATTTNPGFNRQTSSHFELTRFLDSELISDIEFEAELSGILELIRLTGFRI
ncbi:MAG: peptidoglycan/xylan/chitin deacetylase (PgdA/CDA1 family) [Gammaproteobacteria bacterium]|jgi:peptidoglycan/xylan/chitin deacetylase (PgdA/CDA1 family)